MTPSATVITVTRFLGVPEQLLPAPHLQEMRDTAQHLQDQGTEPERLVECAGRTCYDSYGKGRSSQAFHQHVREVGHGSVLEHASISFFVSGISRGCSHELVRHRAGIAISQRSTRYVDESESDWAWHPLINEFEHDHGGLALRLRALETEAKLLYGNVVEKLTTYLIEKGTDKLTARKQARGAARGVLGNALSTELVFTLNVRALRHFLEQRASPHADAEIRLLANAMYEAALPHLPESLGDYERATCPDNIGYALVTAHRRV